MKNISQTNNNSEARYELQHKIFSLTRDYIIVSYTISQPFPPSMLDILAMTSWDRNTSDSKDTTTVLHTTLTELLTFDTTAVL